MKRREGRAAAHRRDTKDQSHRLKRTGSGCRRHKGDEEARPRGGRG